MSTHHGDGLGNLRAARGARGDSSNGESWAEAVLGAVEEAAGWWQSLGQSPGVLWPLPVPWAMRFPSGPNPRCI